MANGFAEHLHYLLTKHVIETGHAPDLLALSTPAGRAEKETEDGLRQLEQMHGVILVPNSTKVWSLHPFALMPSAFWVTVNQRGWWANCAWCSLAIGAALRQDVTITTSDGAEGKELQFNVESGRPSRSDLMLHFPYPPAKWWDNPYSPCGNILFFSSEANIDAWCERHGIREVQSWISKQASNWQSSGLETMLHWSGSVNLRFRQRQSSTNYVSIRHSGVSGRFADSESQQLEDDCEVFRKASACGLDACAILPVAKLGNTDRHGFVRCFIRQSVSIPSELLPKLRR
jgi:hypothetical protein